MTRRKYIRKRKKVKRGMVDFLFGNWDKRLGKTLELEYGAKERLYLLGRLGLHKGAKNWDVMLKGAKK